MTWLPILEGRLQARAVEAVERLCRAAAATWIPQARTSSLQGLAGHVLFLREATQSGIATEHAPRVSEGVEQVRQALAETAMEPSLLAGYAGMAWMIHDVTRHSPSVGDDFENIDEAVLEHVSRPDCSNSLDLDGLAGLGVYALERASLPAGRAILTQIVQRLDEQAERSEEGVAWKSQGPEGQPLYNLGVAHGIPGIVALLAGAAALEIPGAPQLLVEGRRWLWGRQEREAQVRFPFFTEGGASSQWRWPGWCYGDPGIAAALYAGALATGATEERVRALELAGHALGMTHERLASLPADSPILQTGESMNTGGALNNPFICHGWAGRAHLSNRMFQSSQEVRFADSARQWIERILALPELGDSGPGWSNTSLVYGATGVGLVLVAALQQVEPRWDRLLLMSLREKEPDFRQ
jgi:hypothetical protein